MSNYLVDGSDLTSVAAAIRTKGGTSDQLAFPDEFVSAIQAIPTGGAAPTLVTKSITQNGTYNASSDNADGYSSVIVNVAASGPIQPFDTYEFNVPSDINYQDATGTAVRTLATLTFNQATYDKCNEYASLSSNDHPFAKSGYMRVLMSVVPKSYATIAVADATYIKNIRKDTIFYIKNNAGTIQKSSPYWRAAWRLKTNGTLEYGGNYNTSNDYANFDATVGSSGADNGKLIIQTQLSANGGQKISAGDYKVLLYDVTGTVM